MRFLPLAAVAALLLLAPCLGAQEPDVARRELVIATDGGERSFMVEIAADPRSRTIGLMHRRSMADNHGMLFDFGREEPVSFWMRNTYISLDMLFIKADGTIDSIAERTTPLSDRSIPSKRPVRYVLEINGGLSDALGIETGDIVSGPALDGR